MAYEVTATRRRPQHFEDLAGQEFVAETLKNSIKSGQIAHAYLFAGPRGCGKTSSARILAKALNCQSSQGPNPQPCGQCESCKAITNSSSLDVIEIDGASNTSVNDVRQIKDEVMFPPNSARYKIYIIDEVHMLSTSAFNALLKTIEEPPPYVIFIFATTELQKVPATIKSRCQQFNFRLVPVEKIKSLLADVCNEMDIQADEEALYWIAKESGGSIRDSYTLFDQVAAFSDGYITYEKIRDKLGLLGVDRLNIIFAACAAGKPDEAVSHLDEFLQSGISIEQLVSNSTEYLRSLLLIKNGIKKESLLGQAPERYSTDVLTMWNTIQTERALSIFLQLYRDIRYSISPRYELELAFSRLCWLSQYVSSSEVKAAIDQARAVLDGVPEAAAKFSSADSARPVQQQDTSNSVQYGHQQTGTQNTAPDKMPHFSFFDKAVIHTSVQPEQPVQDNLHGQTAVNNEPQNNPQEPSQNPFLKGGALPPETREAALPDNPVSEQESSSEYNSFKDDYFLENDADIPDDDWSNTQVPDDDFYGSEPAETSGGNTAENIPQDFTETAHEDQPSPEQIHENHSRFTAKDGSSIEIGKLFGAAIAELSVNNAMLASALMQTGAWNLTGTKISTTIKTEYQKNFIEQNIPAIISIISSLCHEQMQFEIQFVPERKEEKTEDLPLQVKILCNAFKGNIIGGK